MLKSNIFNFKLTYHNTLTITPIAAGKSRSSLPIRHRRLKATKAGIFFKSYSTNSVSVIHWRIPQTLNQLTLHVLNLNLRRFAWHTGKKFITIIFCPVNHFRVNQKSTLAANTIDVYRSRHIERRVETGA